MATEQKIDELDGYINGLKNDLRAVKNAIITHTTTAWLKAA